MRNTFSLEIHLSKAYNFEIIVLHQSKQVVRFNVKCGKQEMILEKKLLEKRQQWKILSANIVFNTSEALRNFNIICACIDNKMPGPGKLNVHPKNVS